MGQVQTKILNFWHIKKRQHIKILVLGLDNSGKTTLARKFRLKLDSPPSPTVGFNTENFELGDFDITLVEVGGAENIRKVWPCYFQDISTLFWVVDATDPYRFEESRVELKNVLNSRSFPSHAKVFILANKLDSPDAASLQEIRSSFRLDELLVLHTSDVLLFPVIARSGNGVAQVFSAAVADFEQIE